MPVLKRNHRAVAAAKPHSDKRIRYRVEGVAGLWLDVTPNEKRTWYARYQRQIGTSRTFRWYRIGDAATIGLAQATDRARQIIAEVLLDGRDPHQERFERKLTAATFADLFEAWYERQARPRLARARSDRCIYDCHLRGSIAQTAISELRRAHVGLLRDQIAQSSGPTASDNALTLINRVLNWAVDEGLVEYNPAARLRKVGHSRPREHVLTAHEIRTLWLALDRMDGLSGDHIARGESGRILSPATRAILRLMLLTGQRRGEVSQTEKSELQLDGAEPIWAISGARTKNRLLHRVPLCVTAANHFRNALVTSRRQPNQTCRSAPTR